MHDDDQPHPMLDVSVACSEAINLTVHVPLELEDRPGPVYLDEALELIEPFARKLALVGLREVVIRVKLRRTL